MKLPLSSLWYLIQCIVSRIDDTRAKKFLKRRWKRQTMANKGIRLEDLIPGSPLQGAMSLIEFASQAKGSLCF